MQLYRKIGVELAIDFTLIMKFSLIFWAAMLFPFWVVSQSLKPLDYCDLLKRNEVRAEKVEVISFNEGIPIDTCIIAEIVYDEEGRMVKRQDFFSGGRKLSEELFYYGQSGRLDSIFVAHVFDQFRPRKFKLTYSSDGYLSQRELDTQIRNSWCIERYERDGRGRIKEIRQLRQQQDQIILMKAIDFSQENKELEKEASIMFVRAENGLLLVENVFGQEGVTRMLVHSYEHF